MPRPDDWHLHLRDGDALASVVGATASVFRRAIVMPNLKPPVVDLAGARAYRERIQRAARDAGQPGFEPLMTLYLTDRTSPQVIREAQASGLVYACKLYPAGATTNSDAGVTNIRGLDAVLQTMAEVGLPLLVHGEVVHADTDIFDREERFLSEVLGPLIDRHPGLRVVLEHITTRAAVAFVRAHDAGLGATITAHHLLANRNDMLVGGIRPHLYCLPVLKREEDRRALLDAATSDDARFFLGTDSAPHRVEDKESACGCAGSYTAPWAMALYAEAFDSVGRMDRLEAFACQRGPDFYGLPRNTLADGALTIERVAGADDDQREADATLLRIPARLPFGGSEVVPFRAGAALRFAVTCAAA
jgi:dihydroorotase